MKKQYDFADATPSPYAKLLRRAITIRLELATLRYFKQLSEESGLPYQTLINLYLRDCALSGRRLSLRWLARAARSSSPRVPHRLPARPKGRGPGSRRPKV